MAGCVEAGEDAGQRTGEVALGIAHQTVGVGCVALGVAIAGDDQIVGQGAYHLMQVGNQRLAAPFDQPFVLPAHALATATGEQQDGAGRQVRAGHGRRSGAGPVI